MTGSDQKWQEGVGVALTVLNTLSMEEALEQEGQLNGDAATNAGADGAATEATGPGHMA